MTVRTFWSGTGMLWCLAGLCACESKPKASPEVVSSPVKSAPPVVTPVKAAKVETPEVDSAPCLPLELARPLHKELECMTPGLPPERIIVFESQDDVRRYAKRASSSCMLEGVDFKTHVVMAYKATAPCELTVEDSLCSTGPGAAPEYSVTMTSQGFCDSDSVEGRYWALPRPKDLRFGLKRQRRRLPS